MARRISIKAKRREAPEWIYPWRSPGEPLLPRILAVALVATAFGLMLGSLRIRTALASPWASRKASLIQVLDDADGRALTLRAREGGPFPSRFEPAGWPAFMVREKTVLDSSRARLPEYRPVLRGLAAGKRRLPELTEPGRLVLPKPAGPDTAVTPVEPSRLVPQITPLAGIHASAMPDELPGYSGEITPSMAAASTRFIVRLDPSGNVTDCVSLDAADDAGPAPLGKWLRGVSFKPGPAMASRWVAVRVTFANQQTADGTESR